MRIKAEARLKPGPAVDHPETENQRLLHELQVHQIELELQNEELRRAQADLEQSRDRFSALYDQAPVGYLTLDSDGRILEANPTAASLLGVDRPLLVGRHLSRFMSDRDATILQHHRRQVFARGTKQGCDLSIERADGRKFPAHLDSIAERPANSIGRGSVRCQTVLFDLTELRRTQEDLRDQKSRTDESEARFRQIAESIEDVFYVREPSGVTSFVSPAYERIWGRPADALAEQPHAWLETIDEADRGRVAQAWERLQRGESISETYRIRRPDGTPRWVHSRGFPVLGPDGGVLRSVGVVRDVTAERKLEDELRQSQKMEAVGTLASGVAHNLRNVLQAVMSFIRVAQKRGVDSERAAEALDRAVTVAKRGATLTDQLMTFTRKQELAARPLLVDALVREAADLIKPLVGGHILVQVETAADGAYVMADPVQLEQILLNLAANARDAMPDGGTLTLRTEESIIDDRWAETHGVAKGPHVMLSVRDTGSGMDAATRQRVFEPFFTTKEIGKGTGLGLATVFALTRQFGGCIEVDSEKGRGTTFTLCFPALDGAMASPSAPPG
jgi:PAS domain S-box-containing protein